MAIRTRAELAADYATNFPDNSSRQITPANQRAMAQNISESMAMLRVPVVARTGTVETLDGVAAGSLITFDNASAITCTVNTGTLAIGESHLLLQLGAGQVTMVAGASMTILTDESLKLRKQNALAQLLCVSANTLLLFGNIEAAP